MDRISYEDKMRIQTLHEQGLGAKAIRSRYPAKQWSLNTLKTICRRTTKTGSAVTRQSGSGRPKSARTAQNIVSSRNVTVEIRPVSTVPGYVVYHQTRDVSGQRVCFRDLHVCWHFPAPSVHLYVNSQYTSRE